MKSPPWEVLTFETNFSSVTFVKPPSGGAHYSCCIEAFFDAHALQNHPQNITLTAECLLKQAQNENRSWGVLQDHLTKMKYPLGGCSRRPPQE